MTTKPQFWKKNNRSKACHFNPDRRIAHEYAQPERSGGHIAHIRAPARASNLWFAIRKTGGALHFVCAVIPPRASADWEIKDKIIQNWGR